MTVPKPAEAIRAQFAAAIKSRLVKLCTDGDGLSQSKLGERLGLKQSRVSQLLRGDTKNFSIDRLIRMATMLDLVVRLRITRPYERQDG